MRCASVISFNGCGSERMFGSFAMPKSLFRGAFGGRESAPKKAEAAPMSLPKPRNPATMF